MMIAVCSNSVCNIDLTDLQSVGNWELGFHKIFRLARKFFNKSFLTQSEDVCYTIFAKIFEFFWRFYSADHNPA